MKMILCMIFMLVILSTMQALACPLKGEETGGACSISDIKNIEKTKMQEKAVVKEGKNLRPVKTTSEIKNPEQPQCIFCLQEGVFGKIKP